MEMESIDSLHIAGIVLTASWFWLELIYFLLVAVPYQLTVSATLAALTLYPWGMTVGMVASTAICMVYFWCHREGHLFASAVGGGLAAGSIKSWLVIIAVVNSSDITHQVAAVTFMISAMGYMGALIWIDVVETRQGSIWYLLGGATFTLTLVYATLLCTSSESAWILQHASLLTGIASLHAFFWFHPFIGINSNVAIVRSPIIRVRVDQAECPSSRLHRSVGPS